MGGICILDYDQIPHIKLKGCPLPSAQHHPPSIPFTHSVERIRLARLVAKNVELVVPETTALCLAFHLHSMPVAGNIFMNTGWHLRHTLQDQLLLLCCLIPYMHH